MVARAVAWVAGMRVVVAMALAIMDMGEVGMATAGAVTAMAAATVGSWAVATEEEGVRSRCPSSCSRG